MTYFSPRDSRRFFLIGSAILLFLILVAYGASLGNGFSFLDDGLLITENNLLREFSFRTLWVIFTSYDPELYIPLTFLSYQLEYLLFGLVPFFFHATNLILHMGSTLLVFGIVWKLAASRGSESSVFRQALLGFLVAAIFALHPLQVEAVAWAAARKDVLSGFFFLCAWGIYVGGGIRDSGSGIREIGRADLWCSEGQSSEEKLHVSSVYEKRHSRFPIPDSPSFHSLIFASFRSSSFSSPFSPKSLPSRSPSCFCSRIGTVEGASKRGDRGWRKSPSSRSVSSLVS